MKKMFSILFVASTFCFVSCKKEKLDDPVPAPAPPGKKLKETTLDEHRTFHYNADGTIKEIKMVGVDQTMSFTYKPGKVNYLVMSQGKKNREGELIYTNGKMTNFNWSYFDNQGQVKGTHTWAYAYNEKGLVKRITETDGTYREYAYDQNNDMVSMTVFDQQGQAFEKTEYTYGNEVDKFPQYTFISCSDVSFFLPAFSKHLPTSRKITNMINGDVSLHVLLEHVLDAEGYELKGKYGTVLIGSGNWDWQHIYE